MRHTKSLYEAGYEKWPCVCCIIISEHDLAWWRDAG
jgi:hypothetical protein